MANWTLPRPHHFTLPGVWHAAFLIAGSAFFAGSWVELIRRIRASGPHEPRPVLASPAMAGAVACAAAYAWFAASDSVPAAQTASGRGSLISLGGAVILLVACLNWAAHGHFPAVAGSTVTGLAGAAAMITFINAYGHTGSFVHLITLAGAAAGGAALVLWALGWPSALRSSLTSVPIPTAAGTPPRPGPTRVRVISESAFTVRGHGVHSIYEEHLKAISSMDDVELVSGARSLSRSVILYMHTVGPIALARMLIHRGPVVMAAHITPASFLGSIRGAGFLLGSISRYLRFVYNRASVIVAVSAAAAAELALLKVRPPVRVSHNAIDQRDIQGLLRSRESLRNQFGWHDQVIVLAVGQIQPRKGVREFVTCAAALPQLKFIWVGGMPFGLLSAERAQMLRMRSAAPPNVEFAGMKPRDEVFCHYAAADIFFLPSQHETFGLAVLEAAAAGLPLVISDLACYREWLGGAYLAGTSSAEYTGHLRKLAQPQFRDAQGEVAGHAAAGYGGQALTANLRDTFELATRSRHPRR